MPTMITNSVQIAALLLLTTAFLLSYAATRGELRQLWERLQRAEERFRQRLRELGGARE